MTPDDWRLLIITFVGGLRVDRRGGRLHRRSVRARPLGGSAGDDFEYPGAHRDPKSRNGKRTLPLDDALVDALTCLRKRRWTRTQQPDRPIGPG